MTAFPRRGKAERTTPRRKASVAACGQRPYRQDNDTPALNALTALRGAPTSMGRGETPVELLPGVFLMAKKETASQTAPLLPMLKTVEQMSKVSGIGENKLRELMDSGELEYVQNGNRRLIADAAIWDWYHRAKRSAKPPTTQGG